MALLLRFLNGVALAGVHMPGLKLLVDRVAGQARARGTAIYTSSYAVGTATSFLVAGFVDAIYGWRGSFTASGLGPLLAIAAITLLPAAAERLPTEAFVLDFMPVLRDRALMAYVLAFAGNIWEVSAVRAWFVAYLAWALSLPGHYLRFPGWRSFPGSPGWPGLGSYRRGRARIALRKARRRRDLHNFGAGLFRVGCHGGRANPCGAVVAGAGADHQHRRCRRAPSGAVAAADPARRGTALASYAFTGYTAAFVGPVAVGITLNRFGGAGSPPGLSAAFVTMALGSTAAARAMGVAPLINQNQGGRRNRVSRLPSFEREIGPAPGDSRWREERGSRGGRTEDKDVPPSRQARLLPSAIAS